MQTIRQSGLSLYVFDAKAFVKLLPDAVVFELSKCGLDQGVQTLEVSFGGRQVTSYDS